MEGEPQALDTAPASVKFACSMSESTPSCCNAIPTVLSREWACTGFEELGLEN